METRKILIADSSEDFAQCLWSRLQGQYQILWCSDGLQALQMLRNEMPELLITELMLPRLDGLGLLQAAGQEGILPKVIVASRFFSAYVMDTLEGLEISYLMSKPCDVEALCARVKDLMELKPRNVPRRDDARNQVSELLLRMSFRAKLRGFSCTREAILLLMEDPGISMTKELYPRVARRCDGNPKQVEKAIRASIEKAWDNRQETVWADLFPPKRLSRKDRPTNGDFLARVAECLRQERDVLPEIREK